MKIALPVKKANDSYMLSSKFGKTPFFLIFDTETGEIKVIRNEYQNGRDIANILSSKGVKTVITHHIGKGAFNHLKNLCIDVYHSENKNISYTKVIQQFKERNLQKIKDENFKQEV